MSLFPPTRWSVIATMQGRGLEAGSALDELCAIYRPAILAYATLTLRGNREEAEDLTQEFFLDILQKERMTEVDRRLGKFRTFLLTHFQFVLRDYFKRQRAAKRAGGREHISADEAAESEMPVTLPEPSVFDTQWTLAMVRKALALLEEEETKKKQPVPFNELKGYLPGFSALQPRNYEDLAQQFGMSEGSLRVRVNRLRGRFGDLLNSLLADTVSNPRDLEEERQALLAGFLRHSKD